MQAVTITQITPPELEELIEKTLKRVLATPPSEKSSETEWMNIEELQLYHPDKPQRSTIYSWVHTSQIPVHKSGKKLRFLKSEIDNWLQQGRKKTLVEAALEAERYADLKGKGRRKND